MNKVKNALRGFHQAMERLHNPDLAALCIRLGLGIIFVYAGWFKISNLEFIVANFAVVGIDPVVAYLVTFIEFIGGILLILGLFARYAGALLFAVMLGAFFKVHFVNGFSIANGGYEYVLILILGSLAVVTLGAGKYSVGRLLSRWAQRA